jgi:hypothetical protein
VEVMTWKNEYYYGYIMVEEDTLFIKDLWNKDIFKKVMQIKVGSKLKIHRLGMLEVIRATITPYEEDDNSICKEVCIFCRRLDA